MRVNPKPLSGVFRRRKTGIPRVYFFDPYLRINFRFYWNITPDQLRIEIKDDTGCDLIESVDSWRESAARFIPTQMENARVFNIWIQDWKDNYLTSCLLSHECFHATIESMRCVGNHLEWEGEEAFAYYQMYLMRTIYELKEIYDNKLRNRPVRKRVVGKAIGKTSSKRAPKAASR